MSGASTAREETRVGIDRYVLKYELREPDEDGSVIVAMPWSAEPISAALQGGTLVVWALSIDSFTSKHRRFRVVNTGGAARVPRGVRWLATVTSENGIVWHIFDEGWVASSGGTPESRDA